MGHSPLRFELSLPIVLAVSVLLIGCQGLSAHTPSTASSNTGGKSWKNASPPAITGISPASIVAGSPAFTLTVAGSSFTSKSVVQWKGSARSTTYVNDTQLQAAITAADILTAGTADVSVLDSRTGAASTVVSFTILAAGTPSLLSVTTTTLPNGTVGAAYSASLAATGGKSPYTWSVVSPPLPPGLALSPNGVISGTPTSAGQYTFKVQVTDSAAPPQSASTSLSITVAPPPLKITTTSLPSATVNTAYSTTLTGTGGTPPYTWAWSGQLPAGLSLAPSTGVISGTATDTGTFSLTVQLSDSAAVSTTASLSLTVAAASTSGYTRFYSDTSFWNTPIPTNPQIDPNSAAIISSAIAAYSSSANLANTDTWGIALAFASSSSKMYNVLCTMYCTGDTIYFPIPAGAVPSTGSDHHLAVVNGSQELDMWLASYNSSTDTWSAGSRMTNDVSGWGASCAEGQHCNGAVAAGFALLGGAVRPEEIQQGHIDHALSLTTPYTRANYIACPATHTDGKYSDTRAIPEGAQIQLDPTFNVDAQAWPAWEKVIAKALQTYGAFVSDTGGSLALYGVTDQNLGSTTWAWANTPKGPSLSNLPWSQFRVILIQSCN